VREVNMFRDFCKNYFALPLILLTVALIVSNCGGGSDTGIIPAVSSPADAPDLVSKDVKGYIFHSASLSSSEEGEEENFTVLELPVSGEDGFINQLNEYIQSNPSSKSGSSEMDELLNAFTEEAGGFVPLNSWNSGAGLYSVYDDSSVASSIPVGHEGEISSSVLVDAADDLVSLEIVIPGGECYEVETISSSDVVAAKESQINLKSCPEKIIIKPGKCKIFKVFSKPYANLSEAGLQFSLANPDYGCLAGPIFMRCGGNKQTGVAYGILYAKQNLDTPLDTAINVTVSSGQSLSIPVQIVKKTAAVSGRVYTGGVPLVKGYVKSIGPKSFCFLDSEGQYALPKVFQASGRKIVAVWWTQEGSKQVKHREVKYVDVFGDVVVNFGVVVEPTPTPRPPWDAFYRIKSGEVLYQYDEWQKNFGTDQAIQMTLDWLNGVLPASPPVPEGISRAIIVPFDDSLMWVYFEDGFSLGLRVKPYLRPDDSSASEGFSGACYNGNTYNESLPSSLTASDNLPDTTFKNTNILILDTMLWEEQEYHLLNMETDTVNYWTIDPITHKYVLPANNPVAFVERVSGKLTNDLAAHQPEGSYSITRRLLTKDDFHYGTPYPNPTPGGFPVVPCHLDVPLYDTVNPYEFLSLDQYGVIYFHGHCNYYMMQCGLRFEGDESLNSFMENRPRFDPDAPGKGGDWCTILEDFPGYDEFSSLDGGSPHKIEQFYITTNWIGVQYLSGSLVYIDGCRSFAISASGDDLPGSLKTHFYDTCGAQAYLGYSQNASMRWGSRIAYYFFCYLMYEIGRASCRERV